MKKRNEKILYQILNKEENTLDSLLEYFNISKRTLYYSIGEINDFIKEIGEIKTINRKVIFIGDIEKLKKKLEYSNEIYFDANKRRIELLNIIFINPQITIEQMSEKFLVSKNTIVNDISFIKKILKKRNIILHYKGEYILDGNEIDIRELFLKNLENKQFNIVENKHILDFDKVFQLELTDISLFYLENLINFIHTRIEQGYILNKYNFVNEAKEFFYFDYIHELFAKDININIYERAYITTYISSLSSLKPIIDEQKIIDIVNKLISQFKNQVSINIEEEEKLRNNLKSHFRSSYNRIRFQIPIVNPLLEEIKEKYSDIFKITKLIIENIKGFPELSGIREEEIAYISMYFGVYFKKKPESLNRNMKKVLIVCHKGAVFSKILEKQIEEKFPYIDIVATTPIKDIDNYQGDFDYIISTVSLKGYENVIVVNPILSNYDIHLLYEKIMEYDAQGIRIDIKSLLDIIKKYSTVHNEKLLEREILQKFYKVNKKEFVQPMLKELLTEDRIVLKDSLDNWEDAIKIASEPLLNQKTITDEYVDAMIDSVKEHGPYIVLTDYFALPHARPESGVKDMSMSMLILKEPVDLLGKPVNIFTVLASIDNSSHIKALASLTEIVGDKDNIEKLKSSKSSKEVIKMINKEEEE